MPLIKVPSKYRQNGTLYFYLLNRFKMGEKFFIQYENDNLTISCSFEYIQGQTMLVQELTIFGKSYIAYVNQWGENVKLCQQI